MRIIFHGENAASFSQGFAELLGPGAEIRMLPDVLAKVLRDLAFPKQMHWDALLEDGKQELVFGRPIRWLLFLYGGRVVPFTIARSMLASAASSCPIERRMIARLM